MYKNPFDAFFIFSYLEHLPNINIVLRALFKNLTNNGIGLVEVPNFNYIIKNSLFSEFIRDHLFYFTKETLIQTCNNNGFEVVECSNIWHDYIISVVLKKRNKNFIKNYKKVFPLNLKNLLLKQKQIKKTVNNYIDKFKDKEIIIWGAGHQALSFISLIGLSKKISFIVDSAPFKQGKYSPVTHIPIISPDKIDSINVGAIIVIVASYSEEVVKILLNKYNKDFSISLIKENKFKILR